MAEDWDRFFNKFYTLWTGEFMINVKDLCKDFKIQDRRSGFLGSVKDIVDRKFTTKHAVKNISFDIDEGEIIGYIGPNGAGKSTTVKMLSGILTPTSGRILIDSIDPYLNRKENSKNIGVVFGQRTQLWWDIPVFESLNMMKYIYHIPDKQFNENLNMFCELLDLNKFMNTPVRQISLGQRMRADLACALLHNPKILYLDEPTIGLDVVVKEKIRNFIKEINNQRKTTIILTTHDMFDIEKLCSRVMVIDNGSIIFDGDLQNLIKKYDTTQGIDILLENRDFDPQILNKLPVVDYSFEDTLLKIKFKKDETNALKLLDCLREKCRIANFELQTQNIDDIIRNMYNHIHENAVS